MRSKSIIVCTALYLVNGNGVLKGIGAVECRHTIRAGQCVYQHLLERGGFNIGNNEGRGVFSKKNLGGESIIFSS